MGVGAGWRHRARAAGAGWAKRVRHRGVEPRPKRWQRSIITARLMTRFGLPDRPARPTRPEPGSWRRQKEGWFPDRDLNPGLNGESVVS